MHIPLRPTVVFALVAMLCLGCAPESESDGNNGSDTTDDDTVTGATTYYNIVSGDTTIGESDAMADVLTGLAVFTGNLDNEGNATVPMPEIDLDHLPIAVGYIYSTTYDEDDYIVLGNIIPDDGVFRFAAGETYANAPYRLVVAK